jgi:hypothetical protein
MWRSDFILGMQKTQYPVGPSLDIFLCSDFYCFEFVLLSNNYLGSISLTVPGLQRKLLIMADSRIYGLQTLASVNGAVLDFSII